MNKIFTLVAILSLTGCLSDSGGGGSTASLPSSGDNTVAPTPSPSNPSPTNSAPTIQITDSLNGAEGQEIVLHLIGSDADGDALTYTCLSGCISGMSVNAQNEFRWTPNYSQAGTYPITFRVSDGTNNQDYSANIVIANTNRAPVMVAMNSVQVAQGQTASVTPAATDADGDTGVIQLVSSLPANASFSNGVLTFTPSMAQSGSFQFTFRAYDGQAYSANDTITINVSNTNVAPVLDPIGAKSVNKNSNLSFSITASDANTSDVLTVSASGLPSGATFNTSTGAFSWTPSCTQQGTYNVSFQVSDGSLTDSETIAITVNNNNCGAPVWQSSSSVLSTSGENVTVQVTYALDSDGAVTYGYVNESDCNNANWTQSFNASSRALTVTRTLTSGGQTDWGSHAFIVYAQDSHGTRNYKKITLTKNSGGGFYMSDATLGSSYSMTGFCGAGTIYTHP